MEELLTAARYARETKRPARTVQGWVEDKDGRPQNVEGVVRVGKSFAATRGTWDQIADSKGKQGRRNHEPRTKAKPQDTQ